MFLHLFNRIVEKVDNLLITFVRDIRSSAHGTDSCFFGRKRGERRDMGLCCGMGVRLPKESSLIHPIHKKFIFFRHCVLP